MNAHGEDLRVHGRDHIGAGRVDEDTGRIRVG